ncbi:hypothetical protein [Effusibacillus pohliae]|uniref:hypothetical protein n=1 Tax=Effusibacillus pohliae TaxID=232270 RepID=UPI00036C5B6A|nr:hypothetical protein [Effusibacillus pohliae]
MEFARSSFWLVAFSLVAVCILGGLLGRLLAPRVPQKWARPPLLMPAAVCIAVLHANLFHSLLHVGTAYLNHYFFFWWPLCQAICRYHKRVDQASPTLRLHKPSNIRGN